MTDSPMNPPEVVEFAIVGRGLARDDLLQLLRLEDIAGAQVECNPDDEAAMALICSVVCPTAVLSDVIERVRGVAESMTEKDWRLWIQLRGWTVRLVGSRQDITERIKEVLNATVNAEESMRTFHRLCQTRSTENMKNLGAHMFRI